MAHAQQAIQLARDNQLEPWAANGLVRLANAQLVQLHFKEAEFPLTEAMQILQQSPQPRVQALANSTLASLMDQEHHPNKVVEPATAALAYYKQHGFSEGAFSAALLLVRYERNEGQYKQALADGNTLLAVANQRGAAASKMQAEEAIGTVYLGQEQYPDALRHFSNARALAGNDTQRSFQEVHCGEVLWKLGRYQESDEMFKLASRNPFLADAIAESRVESELSQEKYRAALDLANFAIANGKSMALDRLKNLETDAAVAEAHLGMKAKAIAFFQTLQSSELAKVDQEDFAPNQLIAADGYFALRMYRDAYSAATVAQGVFALTNQPESQLRSACFAAEAAKVLNDDASYRADQGKILDILSKLRQTWGSETFQRFIARPSLRDLIRVRL